MNEPTGDRQIHGSCHCGNIRFTLDWPAAPEMIPIRACGCALCRKHGAAWTSNPQGRFSMAFGDEGKVSRYRFGTRTADFHACTVCGVIPIVTCELDGARYAVVNARSFDDVDSSEMVETPTDFDGEATATRLARRKRNWTPES